jgi:hypothetical protein
MTLATEDLQDLATSAGLADGMVMDLDPVPGPWADGAVVRSGHVRSLPSLVPALLIV